MTGLALHDLYDGDEPKIDLDPDVATAIHERAYMLKRPLNPYRCKDDGTIVVTKLVHVGVTPMMMACPKCGGMMMSGGFPKTTDTERRIIEQRNAEIEELKAKGTPVLEVTKVENIGEQPPWLTELPVDAEWYRPSKDEFANLDPEMQQHVMRGGLLKRDLRMRSILLHP